ncbi:hypothetical protein [Laspinema sp. D2d]|uniref:hypothetical protein n=1 Tax=Laspinema sp. D2d TaxID=2953686 RepID=UPI0021BB9A77|nr:hypothetical protein [Laspinema sp. D2d]
MGAGENFIKGVGSTVGLALPVDILAQTISNNGILPFDMGRIPSIGSFIPKISVPNPFKFIKEVVESIANVFKGLADGVLNKLDYVITKAADQLKNAGIAVANKFEEVANNIITNVGETYKELLNQTLTELRSFLNEALEEAKALLHETNVYVEARISQVAEIIASSLNKVATIAEDYTPGKIRSELVAPTLEKIEEMQKQLFKDINNVLDKLISEVNQKAEAFKRRTNLVAIVSSSIGRDTLKIMGLGVGDLQLSDWNYYQFQKAYLQQVIERDGQVTIKERLAVYDEMQENAAIMKFLNIVATPGQNEFFAQEWLEHGLLRQETEKFLGVATNITSGERPSIIDRLIQRALTI